MQTTQLIFLDIVDDIVYTYMLLYFYNYVPLYLLACRKMKKKTISKL